MRTFTSFSLLLLLSGSAAFAQQYCMLPGRTSYSSQQPGITKFKLNTIDRLSLPVEGPLNVPSVNFTGDTTYLTRGQTYTVTIEHSKDPVNFPTTSNNIRVWIDYNMNFSFTDATETVISKDFEPSGTTTATFTVPVNAPLGITRLRATAKMSSDAGHTIPTPCDEPKDPLDYHGEMEDYIVVIKAPTGIEQVNNYNLQASIYPNPVNNDFTVTLDSKAQGIAIDLYDVTGKKTATLYAGNGSHDNTYHFNINNYTSFPGVYFVKITAGEYSTFEKIIKAK
jgi:hypothetical protein